MGMTRLIQNFFDTESEILLAMGQLDEAEKVLQDALEMTRNTPMDISKGYITRTLGKVNLKKGKLTEAGEFLEQSIDIMLHLNMRGGLAECHQLMSSVFEQQGDFAEALNHYKKFFALNESTAGKESARQQAVLKASYDLQLAQRDAEIERLRNFELTAEIEDRKHVQEVLERLATTDMLTNLTNRHHFFILAEREVERALRYKHPLAMLIIDIDLFKNINDTLGHIAGDQVLVGVSQMIHTSMRNLDIAGRYGGDEFCVLLPETDINQALYAAERLRSAIADLQVTTNNGQASVTVSVGVADIRKHVEVITEQLASRELARMLDHADQALYNAKKSGRNSTNLYNANRRVTLKKNPD